LCGPAEEQALKDVSNRAAAVARPISDVPFAGQKGGDDPFSDRAGEDEDEEEKLSDYCGCVGGEGRLSLANQSLPRGGKDSLACWGRVLIEGFRRSDA